MSPRADDVAAVRKPPGLECILIVEDDTSDVLLARRELHKLKILNPIQHVSSCEEMIEYMNGEGDFHDRLVHPLPVVILLDMHLRYADGLDAAAWLRSKLKFRNTPIIAISGSDDQGPKLRSAVDMGAHEAMSKPLKSAEFLKIARKLRIGLKFGE